MNSVLATSLFQRPRQSGPFFDYVRQADREYAGRECARLARLASRARRLVDAPQRTAEQRWEGEGGSIAEG